MRPPEIAVVAVLTAGLLVAEVGCQSREHATARSGVAFRMVWLESKGDQAGTLTRLTFPAGAVYPSQEIRSVRSIHPAGRIRRGEDGNYRLEHETPLAIEPSRPVLVGFAADVSIFAPVHQHVSSTGPSRSIPPAVRRRFLGDEPDYGIHAPAVRTAVERLDLDPSDPRSQLERLWTFVHGHLRYDLPPRPNTGAELLSLRRGLCGEYARLTVTLARAAGIPARETHAFGMFRDGPARNDHAWAEMYLPGAGWVPVQPQETLPTEPRYPVHYYRYFVVHRGSRFVSERRVLEHTGVIQHGDSGVGWFAQDPPDVARALRVLQGIAGHGGEERALLERARREGAAAPVLLWALCASADEAVAAEAAKALVEACRASKRRLSLDKIVAASPTLVRLRLRRASGFADVPAEARALGGNRYYVFDERVTWHEARRYCELLGGHLVTITSQQEQAFVQRLPDELGKGHRFWIGIHDALGNGDWQWVNGEKGDFRNWAGGHPDPTRPLWSTKVRAERRVASTNCGALGFSPHRWVDASPEHRKGFVCEWQR